MKYLFTIALFFLIIGCSKENSAPKVATDSLLQKPLNPVVDTVPITKPKATEWYIDATRIRTPQHIALMKRFLPMEVRNVYHDFKPMRKSKAEATSPEVTKYLQEKKITLDELKAILEEGDRLGWSNTP